MDKVKVGVIGCGYMAQMAHIPCLAAHPQVEIVALCDFRKEVADALCRKWNIQHSTASVEQLLAMDVDAVFVLTPVQWHLHNIEAALKAGKRVFTEKPAAMSAASVRQLIDAERKSGQRVTVGYMKRRDANIEALKTLQGKSDWGRLLYVRTHSFIGSHWNAAINDVFPVVASSEVPAFDPKPLDPAPVWLGGERNADFYSFANPYYALLDTGCHSVNLLRHLAGAEPEVKAVRNRNGVRLVDFDFAGVPGIMEFCINFAMHRWDEVTELYYEKASITIKTPPPLDMQSSAEIDLYEEEGALHRCIQLEDNRQWAFKRQIEAFVADTLAGADGSGLPDAGKDVDLIERIYRMEKEMENA